MNNMFFDDSNEWETQKHTFINNIPSIDKDLSYSKGKSTKLSEITQSYNKLIQKIKDSINENVIVKLNKINTLVKFVNDFLKSIEVEVQKEKAGIESYAVNIINEEKNKTLNEINLKGKI